MKQKRLFHALDVNFRRNSSCNERVSYKLLLNKVYSSLQENHFSVITMHLKTHRLSNFPGYSAHCFSPPTPLPPPCTPGQPFQHSFTRGFLHHDPTVRRLLYDFLLLLDFILKTLQQLVWLWFWSHNMNAKRNHAELLKFKPLLWIASSISIQIKLNFIAIYRIHSKNHKMPAIVSYVLAKIHLSLKERRCAFSPHMIICYCKYSKYNILNLGQIVCKFQQNELFRKSKEPVMCVVSQHLRFAQKFEIMAKFTDKKELINTDSINLHLIKSDSHMWPN